MKKHNQGWWNEILREIMAEGQEFDAAADIADRSEGNDDTDDRD